MRLSAESHAQIEQFLRAHTGDPSLRLPPVSVHTGPLSRLLTRAGGGVAAITFGRHVFVDPSLVWRAGAGRPEIPGWLAVHEAVHVLQYERAGFIGFLLNYLRGYRRSLRQVGKWDAAGRLAAYLEIAEEEAARAAEHAYRRLRRDG